MNQSPENEDLSRHPRLRRSLYQDPRAKVCLFGRDGDLNFKPVRVVVNPRYHHTIDALKNELTEKVSGLTNGVRSIYTPGGNHSVDSLDKLDNEKLYVCSTHRSFARGINVDAVHQRTPWYGGKPPSGRRSLNSQLRGPVRDEGAAKQRSKPYDFSSPGAQSPVKPKKITVLKNGAPMTKHIMLLNRKSAQTFEQVLQDLSEMFQMNVCKMYTTQGKPVKSLSAIFNGPETFVVGSKEAFHGIPGVVRDPAPRPRKRRAYDGDLVAHRLRDKREKLSKTKGKWKVFVSTNELPSAGTTGQVSIAVYGHRANTGPIPLGFADGETFQAGHVDEFEISVGNIGEVYKIRIAHDNSGEFPGWFCEEVRMVDIDTEEELVFRCQRWLSRDEDDGEICRELPAVREGEPVMPVLMYEIITVTGDLWNGGTDANVYITIYGEKGDTGVRQLWNKSGVKTFQKAQMDVFSLEAVTLGHLKRVIVGHDGAEPGKGWFLERVVVKESSKSLFEFSFPCRRWLDEGEDDGKIVRELKLEDEYLDDIRERQLWEYEKWKFGHDGQVMLFSKSTHRAVRIHNDASVDGLGESKDPMAIFNVIPRKGQIIVFQSAWNPHFHLAIDNNTVMGQGRGGAYCEFRARVQEDRSIMLESNKYTMQHIAILQSGKPGEPRGTTGGPPKEFFVYRKGMFRNKGIVILCTSLTQTLAVLHDNSLHATGKRNRLAYFRVHKVAGGGIRQFESVANPGMYIRIKEGLCDCKGTGDKYCHFRLEKNKERGFVAFETVEDRSIYLGMTPEGIARPTKDSGEKNVRFYPEVIEFGVTKALLKPTPSPTPPVTEKPAKQRKRHPPVAGNELDGTPTPPPPTPDKKARSPTPVVAESPSKTEESKPSTAASSSFEDGDWKVWVATAEPAEAAEVALVVYGDKGNSGQIILGAAGDGNLFVNGNKDEFKVNLKSVGKIYKVRVELNGTSQTRQPSWKVKEVKMQDMSTKETLRFRFNCWLSRKQGDREIMRELPAIRPKQDVLAVRNYQVQVYTGKEPGSDTDANIYLTIFGERGDTGRRVLLNSNKETKFEEGQVDIFHIAAVDLSRLKCCVVGHDGDGAGEGWFCHQIVIRESDDADHEYVFLCNRWLDVDQDDKKIERVLTLKDRAPRPIRRDEEEPIPPLPPQVATNTSPPPSTIAAATSPMPEERPTEEVSEEVVEDLEEAEEEQPQEGDWQVRVVTGKEEGMQTHNQVWLYVYGDKGMAGPLPLGSAPDEQIFQVGHTDDFKVNIGTDVGELYKIRIGHDDKDNNSGWFVEKVKMKNLMTNELLTFKVNRWLSSQHDDTDVWRELPVVRPGKPPLPVLVYSVEVYTGQEPCADTEAQVFVHMYGKRGDSGRRLLFMNINSQSSQGKFQPGQRDVFQFEAVDLDDLEKIIVDHDGIGAGAGWFLDKVVIQVGSEEESKQFYFPCGRWFDEGQDDGLIKRELAVGEPPAESKGEYKVWVKTASDSLPPGGASVVLTAYGSKGKSKNLELSAEGAFEAGKMDEFEVAFGDIGELYKIRIGRQDQDNWEGWHLDEVKLQDKHTEQEFVFKFDRWMSRDQDDKDLVREQPVSQPGKDTLPVQQYEVQVYTGNHWAAETDANVYVTVYGSRGDSGKRWLVQSQTNTVKFQRNQVDTFLLEAVTLDDLEKIQIGHDGEGSGAGWFLDKLVIKEKTGNRTSQEFIFPCGRWLDDHEDDRATERTLRLLDVRDADVPQPKPNPKTKTQGAWIVKVKTSDLHNAGSHAQVSLAVYGDKGVYGPKPLESSEPEPFEQGKESTFEVQLGDIGQLYKVRVESDHSKDFPAWHLDSITMTDMHTTEQLTFYVDRWLAQDEADGQLCRELPIVRPEAQPLPVLQYYVAIYTSLRKGTSSSTQAFLTICGEMGDSGRRQLLESQTHDTTFMQGQEDVFFLEAVHLGKLKKIVLEHDGKSKGNAWFVEKVVVKESRNALQEFVFPCNAWLETASNGGSNVKELLCSGEQLTSEMPELKDNMLNPEPETDGRWTVWVTTGDQQEVPLEAPVSLVVYGTQGQSPPLMLEEENEKASPAQGKFAAGATSEFKVNVGDVGAVFKVKMLVERKGEDSAWFLDKVKMKDESTKQEFHFQYGDWVRGTAEEPDILAELPAIRPDMPPLQAKQYVVSITTGSQPMSETDAEVYCMLCGDWGDTGRRLLGKCKNNETKFRKGQTNTFTLSGLSVDTLQKVVIGHTSRGRGRGWFCDRVTVKDSEDANAETIFLCNRWLDSGCEDRQLERELEPFAQVSLADQDKPDIESQGEWKAQVAMATQDDILKANQPSGGNNANNSNGNWNNSNGNRSNSEILKDLHWASVVTVTVYGTKGVAGPLPLESENEDPFAPGKVGDFSLKVGDVGEIYKIRVCNGQDSDPPLVWTIKELGMEDADTKEQLLFDFTHCIGKIGGDIRRELPAVRPNKDILPVVEYQLLVQTGVAQGDGEEPDVYLTVHGSRGDTGPRHLMDSDNAVKFQGDQLDMFTVEAVDLDTLEKVLVHKASGAPWMLDNVIIKKGKFAPTEDVFKYEAVVEPQADVEVLVSEVNPSDVAVPKDQVPDLPSSEGHWTIWTETGGEDDQGATGQVVVVLCGDKGESKALPLTLPQPEGQGQGEEPAKPFLPGKQDQFDIQVEEDIGDIIKVRVGFQDTTNQPSWFLKQIKGQDQTTLDEFTIEYEDWVRETEELDAWRELPVMWPGIHPPEMVKYEVEVFTGDRHDAATFANVHIDIHGVGGSTGKRSLKKALNNENKFEPAQMDLFILEVMDLRQLNKVIIGHDGTGPGSGWYLNKVVVKDSRTPDKPFTFECDRWLDEGEDDGLTERELLLTDAPKPDLTGHPWQMWVTTGEQEKELPGGVALVFYGDQGRSEELLLGQDEPGKFTAGQTDEFNLRVQEEFGVPYKVRIGFPEDTQPGATWQLDKIRMKSLKTGAEHLFDVKETLSRTEVRDGWLEVAVQQEKQEDMLPVLKYKVRVYTGDVEAASTRARVYLTLYGERGDTGKRSLLLSNNNEGSGMFQQSQMDEFEIEAVDLAEVKKVVVGHDGKEAGEGWYLSRVVVQETDKEYYFPCDRWLDVGQDDKAVERELEAVEKPVTPPLVVPIAEPEPEPEVDEGWKVWTVTGMEAGTGTEAEAFVVLYGSKGKTEQIPLVSDQENKFQSGQMAEFKIEMGTNVGEIYKVRVGFVEGTPAPQSWLLDTLRIRDDSGAEHMFVLGDQVVLDDEQDGQVEIAVQREKPEDVLPVKKYSVSVTTGKDPAAGTDANVYLTVIGERGDTGKRKLLKSITYGHDKFDSDHMDLFEIEAVDLLDLKKVIVGHDGEGAGAGWYLSRIIIKESKVDAHEFVFPCDRWLDEGEDDGLIERELTVNPDGLWVVSVTTPQNSGDCAGAISLVVYGNKRKSDTIVFADRADVSLQPGQTQTFEIMTKTLKQLGSLYKVRVGFDDPQADQTWQLGTLTLREVKSGKEFVFDLQDWLMVQDDLDFWREIPVTPYNGHDKLPVYQYQVEVYTGKRESAGTKANVYICIHGDRGDTGVRQLLKAKDQEKENQFEAGQVATFDVEAVDMLELTKIIVGHDGKDSGAGWFLKKVVITDGSGHQYIFPCNRWLDAGEEDGAIERQLDVKPDTVSWKCSTITGKGEESAVTGPITLVVYGEKGVADPVHIATEEGHYFESEKTDEFDVMMKGTYDLGDLYKVRIGFQNPELASSAWYLEMLKLVEQSTGKHFVFDFDDMVKVSDVVDFWRELPVFKEEEADMLPVHQYQVEVHTGDQDNAGTKANVYICIHGDRGDTGVRQLLKAKDQEKENQFEAGQVATFDVEAVDMLDLTKVIVGHDKTSAGDGWFLKKVIIRSPANPSKEFIFECNRWLDQGEDDGLIERELKVKPEVLSWKVSTTTAEGAETSVTGPITLVVYGENGVAENVIATDESFKFDGGQTDVFDVTMKGTCDLGELYKVRVGFQKPEEGLQWALDTLKLTEEETGKEYIFDLHDSVKVTDEVDYWREIQLFKEEAEEMLTVCQYQVGVFTGTCDGAGTQDDVYICIHGNQGDTGFRKLLKTKEQQSKLSKAEEQTGKDGTEDEQNKETEQDLEDKPESEAKEDNSQKAPDQKEEENQSEESGEKEDTRFGAGQISWFEVEAVDMLDLTKVIVRHDGKDSDACWFLDKIVIKESEDANKEYIFLCNRWFGENQEDGVTERELTLKPDVVPWKVSTVTMEGEEPAVTGPITVVVYGEKGVAEPVHIATGEGFRFDGGQTDVFDVMMMPTYDLGDVYKVRVGFQNEQDDLQWALHKMTLLEEDTGKQYVFDLQDWVQVRGEQDYWREMAVVTTDEVDMLPVHQYEVEVHTGSDPEAGTNANVYISIHGERGDTGVRRLLKVIDTPNKDGKKEEEAGESADQDGEKEKEEGTTDSNTEGAGEKDGSAKDTEADKQDGDQEKTDEQEEDNEPKKTRFEPGQVDRFYVEAVDMLDLTKVIVGHDNQGDKPGWLLDKIVIRPAKDACKEYVFLCNRWFDENKDDGLLERELEVKPEVVQWTVSTITAEGEESAVTGPITLVVYGEKDIAEPVHIATDEGFCFEGGKTDLFDVMMKMTYDLGELYKVRVGFQNPKDNLQWSLNTLKLKEEPTGKEYVFDLKDKVKVTEEVDFWREMPVTKEEEETEKEDPLPVHQYHVQVYTGEQPAAATDANVYLCIHGNRGDTGFRELKVIQEKKESEKEEDKEGKEEDKEGKEEDKEGKEEETEKKDEETEKKAEEEKDKETKEQRQEDGEQKAEEVQEKTEDSHEEAEAKKYKFEAGQMMEFFIEAVDMLDLTKVIVKHDGEEAGAGWFLDKIVIKESKEAEKEYVFLCNRWLDAGEEDGAIERELHVKPDVVPWKVQTTTSEGEESAVTGPITLVVYGEKGVADPAHIATDEEFSFEGGNTDDFDVMMKMTYDLGELYKVRVGFQNPKDSLQWSLDTLKLIEEPTGKEYVFDLKDKVKVTEETDFWREMPVKKEENEEGEQEDPLPVHQYHVQVYTGDQPEAATDANVYLCIHGNRGDTGFRELKVIEEPDESRTEEKDAEGKDKDVEGEQKEEKAGEEEKSEEGTDEEKKEKDTEDEKKKEGEEDSKQEEQKKKHKFEAGQGLLLVGKITSDDRSQVIFHTNNNPEREKYSSSYSSHMMEFYIEAVDMLDLTKVIVKHDGEEAGAGWFLDKIVIRESKETEKEYVFLCDRWLDVGEDDSAIERELEVKPEVVPWKVSTTTGEGEESAVTGPITLVVYGEEGVTDPVYIATENDFKFEPGKTDDFDVMMKAVCDLGTLYKVRVGVEEHAEDITWNLHKLKLTEEKSSQEFEFELGELVQFTNDIDGWKEMPLQKENKEEILPVNKYQVEVYTGSQPEAGTEANVYINIHGNRGDTGVRKLLKAKEPKVKDPDEAEDKEKEGEKDREDDTKEGEKKDGEESEDKKEGEENKDGEKGEGDQKEDKTEEKSPEEESQEEEQKKLLFQPGQMVLFEIEAVDLLDLKKVIVGHDGKGAGAGWFLDKIIIRESEEATKQFVFKCERWLDEGEDDSKIERELEVEEPKDGDWQVTVTTKESDDSTTDAQVTLTVFGDQGSSGPMPLGAPGTGLFQPGTTDQFDIWLEPAEVGKIQKIRIEHDGSTPESGWQLEKIVMENTLSKDTLEFKVDQWLAPDRENGDVVRELPAEWPDSEPLPVTKYEVRTVTGKEFGGGTDAKVYITLHGEEGDSGKRFLRLSKEGKDMFEKGKTDTFTVEAVGLGKLTKVTVGHDGSGGEGSGWYLDKIIVKESPDATEEFIFPCDNWLSSEEGDGQTERELMVEGGEENKEDGPKEDDKDDKPATE